MSNAKNNIKGLSTLALLKTNFDQNKDHISMFEPFVIDSIISLGLKNSSIEIILKETFERHGLMIPVATMRTILKRLSRKGLIEKIENKYFILSEPDGYVDIRKEAIKIEREHNALASDFIQFSRNMKIEIVSNEEALSLLILAIEENHVILFLEDDKAKIDFKQGAITAQQLNLVTKYLLDIYSNNPTFTGYFERILEGYVLQNTLLLKDISEASRLFSDLEVYFDSNFLLYLIGMMGEFEALSATETIRLLKEVGATTSVFERTIREMEAVLSVYVRKLGSSEGRESLWPTEITRHVLSKGYTPSDIKTKIACIEPTFRELGIHIKRTPLRNPRYTFNEKKLSAMIKKSDEDHMHPRVRHDVDCTAGILTLRRGHTRNSLDNIKAVFATTTGLLVKNVMDWYVDEGGVGMPPVVHIVQLTNMAWLKKPASAPNLKMVQLIALCHAAIQPARKTWELFIKHLQKLEAAQEITSEQSIALMVDVLLSDDLYVDEADYDDIQNIIRRGRERITKPYEDELGEVKLEIKGLKEEQQRRNVKLLEQIEHYKKTIETKNASIVSRENIIANVIFWPVIAFIAVIIILGADYLPEIFGEVSKNVILWSQIIVTVLPIIYAIIDRKRWIKYIVKKIL